MKLNKLYVVVAFLLLSSPTIAQRPHSIKKIEADSAWNRLELILKNRNVYDSSFVALQNRLSKYREEGRKFWDTFSNDSRKYDWLYKTARFFSGYLLYLKMDDRDVGVKSILRSGKYQPSIAYTWPLNQNSLKEWEAIYPKLKKEFSTYCNNNPKIGFGGNSPGCNQEIGLLVGELLSFFELSLNREYRPDEKIDLDRLITLFTTITNVLDKEPDSKTEPNGRIRDRNEFYEIMGWAFIDRYKEYGLSTNDMKDFLNTIIKRNPNATAQKWAMQRNSLITLLENPLSLKHISIHDKVTDLERLRGKVVLVDFWSIWCSSCVARMPAIKIVYDKYKDKGFEVISACLNDKNNANDLASVIDIERKIGANWSTLMIGRSSTEDSLGQKIWRKYGFWGVPQMLLLNKHGKLVMLNDILRNGDFEPLVKQLLAEIYESN